MRVVNPEVSAGTMDVGRVTGADVSAGGGVEVSAVMGVVINAVI